MPTISLNTLNRLDSTAFVEQLGGIFEHSPWIPAAVVAQRPFSDIAGLHAAMVKVVAAADRAAQLALIRAHPELAGKAAIAGKLTAESTREQQGAGLDLCSPEEFTRLQSLNRAYNEKFGFPFIVAVRGHTRTSILDLMQQRLENGIDTEMEECLQQIYRIARLRLEALIE